jgi:hypothetical protein
MSLISVLKVNSLPQPKSSNKKRYIYSIEKKQCNNQWLDKLSAQLLRSKFCFNTKATELQTCYLTFSYTVFVLI